MSWYKAIRVKCIIKEEFRKDFEPIALYGKWNASSHPILKDFGYDDEEAAFIPTHRCNFPIDWDGCDAVGEEYETKWNPETGEWVFACSINSVRCSVIRDFEDDIAPIIVDHFIKYEFWIEPLSAKDPYDPVDITDYMNSCLNDEVIAMNIADLIREFCEKNADQYYVHENYSGRGMFGRKCLGIVVRQGNSYMEMLMKLTQYLDDNSIEDAGLKMEGVSVDDLGLDTVVYFPSILE